MKPTSPTAKIDTIIQYVLLLAGEDDEYTERSLGAIHLIKYVYLSDLIHAERKNGQTFTGVNWRFYKFGPWSQSVNSRIEPSLRAIQAQRFSSESYYSDDDEWVRWQKRDFNLLEKTEKNIPILIRGFLKKKITKYGKDTPSLLDFVYKTDPMLSAAPHEYLDFSLAVKETDKPQKHQTKLSTLSKKKQKKLKERMKELRNRKKERKSHSDKLVKPPIKPIYDDVYQDGIEWLDTSSVQEFSSGKITVEFSNDIWHSGARKNNDIS